MPNIEKLSHDIEQGIAKHDSQAMQNVMRELQSWKAHGATQTQIDAGLRALDQKLHHDGYLPGLNIVGFEKGDEGKLIVNKAGSHDLLTVDKNATVHDQHKKEQHMPLTKHEHKEPSPVADVRATSLEGAHRVWDTALHPQDSKSTGMFNAKEFAAGMDAFRGDLNQRASLLRENPQLYAACKKQDQQDIEKEHGWGRKIRHTNGVLIDYTVPAAKEIRRFEISLPDCV